jgi:hypothetical protein
LLATLMKSSVAASAVGFLLGEGVCVWCQRIYSPRLEFPRTKKTGLVYFEVL